MLVHLAPKRCAHWHQINVTVSVSPQQRGHSYEGRSRDLRGFWLGVIRYHEHTVKAKSMEVTDSILYRWEEHELGALRLHLPDQKSMSACQ